MWWLPAFDLSLSNSIYLLGWGKRLLINFPHLSFCIHDHSASCNDFMLEEYLLILGVVYQIDGLSAAVPLLVLLEGEDSIQYWSWSASGHGFPHLSVPSKKYWNLEGSLEAVG